MKRAIITVEYRDGVKYSTASYRGPRAEEKTFGVRSFSIAYLGRKAVTTGRAKCGIDAVSLR